MKQVIHTKAIRLKCDACGYQSEPVKLSPRHVGAQCPECHAVMVTAGDYKAAQRLFGVIDTVNAVFGPLFGREPVEGEKASIKVTIGDDHVDFRRKT